MIGRTNCGSTGNISTNAAIIHVIASINSTITFSKNNIIIKVLGPEKSHINANDNTQADWYYSISSSNYGTWTVMATKEGSSSSKIVEVNANQEYTVSILYPIYLVQNGVFVNQDIYGHARAEYMSSTISENAGSYMEFAAPKASNTYSTLYFLPKVDMALRKYLVCDGQGKGPTNNGLGIPGMAVLSGEPIYGGTTAWSSLAGATVGYGSNTAFGTRQVQYIDLSNISGSHYIALRCAGSGSYTAAIRCYNFYLSDEVPT